MYETARKVIDLINLAVLKRSAGALQQHSHTLSLAHGGEALGMAESAPLIEGGLAMIKGLMKRADLNGSQVTLVRWEEAKGRWAVKPTQGTSESICVLPSNLEPCEDESAAAPSTAAPASSASA